MRYLSVCSGIEAATVAWHPLGWEPVAFSEIEPFPCAVLAHHYPDVPNLGDMTAIHKSEVFRGATFDVLCGGTPCQAFSVAGLRKGLADPRGNLALEFLRLADLARPRWLVWENVTGVLSSNKGRDLGAFLGALGQLGYGWAYRVLDAQFYGLAQRRKRVFVVGYLGGWQRAAAVLFERHCLSGDPAPSREAGAGVTGSLEASSARRGFRGAQEAAGGQLIPATTGTLQSLPRGAGWRSSGDDAANGLMIPVDLQNMRLGREDLAGTLLAEAEPSRGGGQAVLAFNARQDPDMSGNISHPLGAKDTGHGLLAALGVRRLTPRECERLMGFDDDYTLVPYRGRPATDGPRYRAIGNSWAVTKARWLGRRIVLVDAIPQLAQ